MDSRPKNIIALFDVDGTLTVPRKVRLSKESNNIANNFKWLQSNRKPSPKCLKL